MTQDDLVIAHLRELLKVEASAIKGLLGIYREETKRILDEIAVTPDDTFRFQHLNGLLAQLEAGVRQMEARVTGKVAAEVRRSQSIGLRQAGREVAELAKHIPKPGLPTPPALEAAFAPLINLDSLRALHEASKLSTKRWAAGELQDAQRVLIRGVLEKKSSKQVAEDLRKVMGPNAKGYEIERIARTEVWKAANDAYRAGNEAIAERYPDLGLKHRWVAILDQKCTTGVCPRLHDQERPIGGTFKDPGGAWSGVGPLVHPNCRCRLMVVTPAIKNPGETLEEKRARIQAKLNAL